MFGLTKKKATALLTVSIGGKTLCTVDADELPCEKNPSAAIKPGDVVSFEYGSNEAQRHAFLSEQGFAHFSVRVHANHTSQIDCAITQEPAYDPQAFSEGNGTGIRFQPLLLAGSSVTPDTFRGRGLFRRGLHYPGHVTAGNISLGCACDACGRGFRLQSFHAGFSECAYFYSASGKHTLVVSATIPGAPGALSPPEPDALAALERQLPSAPDGSAYRYLNPLRCPHCAEPYIDFERFPEDRPGEYYGNVFFGEGVQRWSPPQDSRGQ